MELTAYLLTTPYLSDILGRVLVTYDRCSKMCGIKSCVHRKVAGLASEVNPLILMLRLMHRTRTSVMSPSGTI